MSRFSKWGARHEEHMQHLEEGTIHAWLDEALSSEEAARVEAHVQECGECAAMVADARGLIAGASRIVSALDIVPGGVLPKTTPVAPAPGKSLWRSLHLTPFRAALAAALMLPVASVVVLRGRHAPGFAERSQYRVMDTAMAPTAAAAPTAVAAPPPAPTAAKSATASAHADSVVPRKRERASTQVMQATEPLTDKALAAPKVLESRKVVASADTTVRVVDSTRVVADARASAPAPAATPPVVANRADSAAAKRLGGAVTTAAGARGGGRGGQQAQARAAMEAPRRALLSENSFASGYGFVGCYQVSDSTNWPRTLPTQFLLAGDSTAAGTRNVRLVRDARVDTSVVGSWRPTGPGMALVSFNSTTPVSRFLLTQGPVGTSLTQVSQDARQERAAQTPALITVRMSCR